MLSGSERARLMETAEGRLMNNGKVNWQGSLTAAVTPFTRDGALNEQAFCDNLALLIGEGVHGLVVSGCTGESWAMTPSERTHLFRLAVDVARNLVPVIAGTGTISTDTVIEMSQQAKAAGAAGVMVLPPYYCMAGRRERCSDRGRPRRTTTVGSASCAARGRARSCASKGAGSVRRS